MPSARRLSTWSALLMACMVWHAHAESPWPATSSLTRMVALDDRALTAVQGAALDAATLAALQNGWHKAFGQDRRDKNSRGDAEAEKATRTAQTVAALDAALALQTNMAMRLSTAAVSGVNTATQIGGTLIALTPIGAISPIGLPLFGLPALPPRNSR